IGAMDRVTKYRQIIRDFLTDFAKIDANAQLIFDDEHDRYLVMHNEWRNNHRIYGCAMQVDVIDGQVWLQHNSTEIYVDRELIQRGIAPQDIIFGFRSPSVRKLLAAANG
ncbi:MAG: XisI protein, partial [Pseudanabaenaceae cyanobacterium bins.39]|nr:XisI protein [Pseudanabaenaceae cyanobacterium bins.39]